MQLQQNALAVKMTRYHVSRKEKPCYARQQLLKNQMELFGDPSETEVPFHSFTESDTEGDGVNIIKEYNENVDRCREVFYFMNMA